MSERERERKREREREMLIISFGVFTIENKSEAL